LELRLRVPWFIVWPAAVCVIYGALCLLVTRSVYYPTRYPNGWWGAQFELGASDVWLTTRDGVRIHGWFVRNAGSPWLTLFFHGNAGNVTNRKLHFLEIRDAGSSILMIDYRGYGRSGGDWPTEAGLYSDACGAYEWAGQDGYKQDRIIAHGESLGTAVAVDLATRRRCAGLVLEAPFTSAKDVAATALPVLGPVLIWGFDLQSKIAKVNVPVLIVQGDRDEVIPPRLGQALFAAAREPKSFWVVAGAGHNDLLETAGREYRNGLASFYADLKAAAR
jgi:fermentation-respiration switch protein FrsA (DUF1100 family)